MKKPFAIIACCILPHTTLMVQTFTLRAGADAWKPYTMDPAKGQEGYTIDIMRKTYRLPLFLLAYKLYPFVARPERFRKPGSSTYIPTFSASTPAS
ncbi:MAG: hypothetical protein KKI09_01955 [Spirochaetes bacterium]|nr:hypothetical protein [Spirochaetota bacterium]